MNRRLFSIITAVILTGTLTGCSVSVSNGSPGGDHLARIMAAGKITVATEGAWSPFTYHDEKTNELVGFDVEVAREIAKRIGVEAEFAEVARVERDHRGEVATRRVSGDEDHLGN